MNIFPNRSIKDAIHKSLCFFLNSLLPQKCFKCGVSLIDLESRSICNSCLNQISLIKPPFCGSCGLPFQFNYHLPQGSVYFCEVCRNRAYYFDKARSLGKYEGVLKEAMINYKYKGNLMLLNDFMKFFFKAHKNNHCFNSKIIDLILYVPLHKKKLVKRNFDQAYLLAKSISILLERPIKIDLLFKKKETLPQAGLKKQMRINNVRGAFGIRKKNALDGKRVLLVDDVFTTGATLNECSKVLKKNGAQRIEVFTLARAI